MKKRIHKSFHVLLLTMALLAASLTVAITPIEASAKVTYEDSSGSSSAKKAQRFFKDVKKKTIYRSEIEWLANRKAFNGIARKGKNFYPSKTITRRQVGQILDNLYGDRITIKITNPSQKATQKFVTSTLQEVSTQLGCTVNWDGGAPNANVSRSKASHYIYQMISCADGKLDPI